MIDIDEELGLDQLLLTSGSCEEAISRLGGMKASTGEPRNTDLVD